VQGFPERFVTDQVGHAYAATTAIYTGVSDDYKNPGALECVGGRVRGGGMTRKMGVRWHLREVMAARGMFSTTDLIAPLAERRVEPSREQVYRLVTGQPERLNLYTLAALCDVLGCGVGELIEPVVERRVEPKAAGSPEELATKKVREGLRPVRARIVDPDKPAET
jgi:DNA-binding Xre family transcriptional regulator